MLFSCLAAWSKNAEMGQERGLRLQLFQVFGASPALSHVPGPAQLGAGNQPGRV